MEYQLTPWILYQNDKKDVVDRTTLRDGIIYNLIFQNYSLSGEEIGNFKGKISVNGLTPSIKSERC